MVVKGYVSSFTGGEETILTGSGFYFGGVVTFSTFFSLGAILTGSGFFSWIISISTTLVCFFVVSVKISIFNTLFYWLCYFFGFDAGFFTSELDTSSSLASLVFSFLMVSTSLYYASP